jgi:O-antigen ligase
MAGADDAPGLARSLLASAYVVCLIAITQELGGLVPGSTACGAVRPYATFGNAVALGAFLAMIAPYAISEFIAAGTWPSRLLASNLIVAIGLALVFSFTRSAWIGAAAGCAIVLIARRRELMASRARLVGLLAFAGVAAVVATMPIASGWSLGRCTAARVVSIAHPTLGSAAVRPHIWMDTVQLIASRPITGYGPDTFALVFPRFQSQDWIPGELIDKAHSDLLQVGATQGVLGIAAYLWLMVAFVRHFWRGRRTTLAWGTFAGVVGYQLAMQANFSWVPSALPFWLFLAAAVTIAVPEASATRPSEPLRRPAVWPQIAVVAGATALVMALVVRPYLADHDFKAAIDAIDAGNRPTAIATAGEARRLAPEQSIYAVEAGNLAMDLRADGRPGPAADWSAARDDFRVAIQLGTGDPVAFRGLAVAERQLDDRAQAIAAARRALELDRFDPANGSLVRALEQGA